MDTLMQVITLIAKYAKIGGALWGLWGAVVFGGALKDHNGPQMQAGIWQIVGGAMIIAASVMFNNIV